MSASERAVRGRRAAYADSQEEVRTDIRSPALPVCKQKHGAASGCSSTLPRLCQQSNNSEREDRFYTPLIYHPSLMGKHKSEHRTREFIITSF